MLLSHRLASAVLLPSLLTSFAVAANTHVPTPSTWTLNVGESNFGSGPSMKSDVVIVTVDTDNMEKSTDKKKFTSKCIAKTKDGKQADQTLVYDRTR